MKIAYLPYQPHCFAFGGFEVQMLAAFDSLNNIGTNVFKLDVWDKTVDFDVVHCWGLDIANYENVKWAKKSGKKVVVTALVNYFETKKEIAKFFVSSIIYKQKLVKEMLSYIDTIVVVNEKQANVFIEMYKISPSKITIIPNIVNELFFDLHNKAVSLKAGSYVLTVGNVCKRKNQLNLAKACILEDRELVIIGKPLAGEENYHLELEHVISGSSKIKWIKGLAENSNELLQYFLHCSMFALPSYVEQQPIALLEAAVLNKPLLIAHKAYAKQSYYNNSYLVNPDSVNDIAKGIRDIYAMPVTYVPDYKILDECRSINVATSYIKVYNKLFQ